ncbi:hypothetical protein GIB67_012856 [Kingdonia uniflora]|uniref:F-box domain-containing protein n=1 Tax=Kingdonia uniflora TaxID=39325 RepID=A0A7J7NFD8_9MAGN|nr:hypothetical protein GIB67_012856 [Kingdonia uniflora]
MIIPWLTSLQNSAILIKKKYSSKNEGNRKGKVLEHLQQSEFWVSVTETALDDCYSNLILFLSKDWMTMSKRQQCLSSNTEGSATDRISSLPDPIIYHILSFLPAVDVVQTCILSKRWGILWCSVPTLDFDNSVFNIARKNFNKKKKKKARIHFVKFVENVLLMRDGSDIYKFRLKLDADNNNTNRVCAWISLAIRRNVQVLQIYIPYWIDQPFELPPSLLRCKSLRVLELWFELGQASLNLPTSLWLSNLKTLYLKSVMFYDSQSVESLISSCPALETLVLESCGVSQMKSLTISTLHLKKLTITDSNYVPGGKLRIITPALTNLSLTFTIPDICVFEELHSLSEAVISLLDKQLSDKVLQFLRGLRDAKSVTLCTHFHDIMISSLADNVFVSLQTPLFNVKCLKMKVYPRSNRVIESLLKYCPNVEALALDFYLNTDIPQSIEMGNLQLDHLTSVNIECFSGYSNEVEVVKYLLNCSVVLKKMIVCCHFVKNSVSVDYKELIKSCPRGSPDSEIVFIEPLYWKSKPCF